MNFTNTIIKRSESKFIKDPSSRKLVKKQVTLVKISTQPETWVECKMDNPDIDYLRELQRQYKDSGALTFIK